MNENIKRLWDRAAEQQGCMDTRDWDAHVKFMSDFAEEIVKECASICDDHPAWTARMVGNQIKDHFGVDSVTKPEPPPGRVFKEWTIPK